MTYYTHISEMRFAAVVTPSFKGCILFLKSWIKGFGQAQILFKVPLQQRRAQSKPLMPTFKTIKGEK
jgi:hypothetical protein